MIARCFVLLLVFATTVSAQPFVWQEAENYVKQQGAPRLDGKRAAASFACLGRGWGRHQGDFAEYQVDVPESIDDAVLHLRYALGIQGPCKLDLSIDDRRVGPSPTFSLPTTDGWGGTHETWRFVTVKLGPINSGKHSINIAARNKCLVNLDGFYIAPADFPLAGMRDGQVLIRQSLQQNKGILGKIWRREPAAKNLSEPACAGEIEPAQADIFALLDQAAEKMPAGLRDKLAHKPSPYLVKAYDVGEPTDVNKDIPWHLLDKDKDPRFDNPHLGKLGLFNTNADISWLIGLGVDGGAVNFDPPRQYRDHLINLAALQVDLVPLQARFLFLPVTSDTVLAVLELHNPSNKSHTARIQTVCTKPPVEMLPVDRYKHGINVTSGKLNWVGFNQPNRAIVSCYDEWNRRSLQPAGSLLCTMQADRRPSAHRFSLQDDKETKPREGVLTYEIDIPAGESRQLILALNLHRFGPKRTVTDRGYVLYPKSTLDQSLQYAINATREALIADWPELVRQSYQWYQRMPVFELPRESWEADVYCCLELPRANTWSAQDRINSPWYTFCRAHGHDPWGWWSYGIHGHEHLCVFTTNLIDPGLSKDYLRGHFQVQREDGFVQYGVNHRLQNIHRGLATCPFLMWEAWSAYTWSGDREYLKQAYQVGKKYMHFWCSAARTRNDLPLQHWKDFVETVRDDADLVTWTATGKAENQEALDLNCYLLKEEKALAKMARELGLAQEAQHWQQQAERRTQAMREKLWHETDGLYYGRDLLTGTWARAQDISTFFPLWAGLATDAQSPGIISLLHEPESFGTDYPVANLAVRHMPEEHKGEFHWKGGNWVELSWLVILGAKETEYYDEAARLAEINCRMVFSNLEQSSHFREYYNSITGERTGHVDYIWTVVPAAMVTDIFLGVRPTAEGLEILPSLPKDWDKIAVENLHVRDSVIALQVQRSTEVKSTQVTVNQKSWDIYKQRGAFVLWDELPSQAIINITQPIDLPTADN